MAAGQGGPEERKNGAGNTINGNIFFEKCNHYGAKRETTKPPDPVGIVLSRQNALRTAVRLTGARENERSVHQGYQQ